MTSYDVVMTSGMSNGGHLGPPSWISWISPNFQESAEFKRELIRTNKGTQIWSKNKNVTEGKVIFLYFR